MLNYLLLTNNYNSILKGKEHIMNGILMYVYIFLIIIINNNINNIIINIIILLGRWIAL